MDNICLFLIIILYNSIENYQEFSYLKKRSTYFL